MVEYTLCYTPLMRKHTSIVLIRKSKPEWQAGKLNMPGGHVEPGETPLECAKRELEEETGLVSTKEELMGQLSGPDYRVHVVFCRAYNQFPASLTKEEVVLPFLSEAVHLPDLIENLKIVIPLCLCGVKGWDIQGNYKVSFSA